MKKFYRNISYNFLGQLWALVMSFIVTPIMVNKMGSVIFGVYSFIFILFGYFYFLDFGIGAAIIKESSEKFQKNDINSINEIVGTSIVVYFLAGIIGGSVMVIFSRMIVIRFLHIPFEFLNMVQLAFCIGAFSFCINMLTLVFDAELQSLQRFDIRNKIRIFSLSILNVGIVVILTMHRSLIEILIWNLIITFITLVFNIFLLKKTVPTLRIIPQFSFKIFKRFIRFGGFVSATKLGAQLMFYLDKLLIGFLQPISTLTYYVIPSNLAMRLNVISMSIDPVTFPSATAILSQNKIEDIRNFYLRASKINFALMFPLAIILILFSKDILLLWLGQDFATNSTSVLILLTISNIFCLQTGTAHAFALALGKPWLSSIKVWIEAILITILCILLIPSMGIKGAAVAFLISTLLVSIYFLSYINHNVLGLSFVKYIDSVLKVDLFIALFIVIFVSLFKFFVHSNFQIILLFIATFLIYAALLFKFSLKTNLNMILRNLVHSNAGKV